MSRTAWRDGTLLGLAVALPGVSFGAVSVAGGLPAWAPVAMSVLVFAGGSQFAAVGVLAAGAGALPAVLTGLLLNLRLLPYGLTMADTVVSPTGHRRSVDRWLLPHLLVDESVGLAQTHRDPAARRAAFLGGGWGVFVGWNLGVLAGIAVGQVLGDPTRLGLDAALPAVLIALIVGAVRAPVGDAGSATGQGGVDRPLTAAAVTGAAIGVAAHGVLPPGLDVVAGLAGGLVVLLPRGRAARPTRTADTLVGRP